MTHPEDQPPDPRPTQRHRSIYLLPNLFTTAAMFAGFFAIIAAQNGRYNAAAVAIFIAMLLDTIDGRIARMTHTQTAFGAQYDSLADLISFGLAPALVMYEWSLHFMNDVGPGWAKPGWLAAFFYTAAAAMRLARFNTLANNHTDKPAETHFFVGLPSPTAAALMIGMVWIFYDMDVSGEVMRVPAFLLTLLAGALMVSNFRYLTFKDIDFKSKVPFIGALLIVVALMAIAFDPPKILFSGFLIYTLSAPITFLFRFKRKS